MTVTGAFPAHRSGISRKARAAGTRTAELGTARPYIPLPVSPDAPLPDRLRQHPDPFPAPDAALRAVVAVPAKNEAAGLPRLIGALAGQQDQAGRALPAGALEVILFLNNTTDAGAAVARRLQAEYPTLALHVAEATLVGADAHVGQARQRAMDLAFGRLLAAGRPGGLVLTTDADTRPALDWVAQNEAEAARGADLVGGRVLLEPAERRALTPEVRALYLLDVGYRRLLERLADLYCPAPQDPFPRHHQHYGASLAVTAAAYAAVGGLPAERCSEDVALVRAVESVGGQVRHSDRVRAFTSARREGRAPGGLASAFQFWDRSVATGQPVRVEAAWHAERRWAAAARRQAGGRAVPLSLRTTPDPAPETAVPIREAVRDLRVLTARLAACSPPERLRRACRLPEPFSSLSLAA